MANETTAVQEVPDWSGAKLANGEFLNYTKAIVGALFDLDHDKVKIGDPLATPLYWYSWPWQIKATLDRFYSFLVGNFDLKGKKAALIASCGEPTVEAMEGLVFSFKKLAALLGLEDVGHVLVPGLHETEEYKATDACDRAAALADKF